jgi:hypothetical protein
MSRTGFRHKSHAGQTCPANGAFHQNSHSVIDPGIVTGLPIPICSTAEAANRRPDSLAVLQVHNVDQRFTMWKCDDCEILDRFWQKMTHFFQRIGRLPCVAQ